jgi:phenylacetyl-CoA:acceptor oxidoreductase subunit 2
MSRIAPWHQTNWDWRAAANFIGGGTGTGLVIAGAVAHFLGTDYRLAFALGLVFVATGLFFVWLEIGKPWRAVNVLRQPQMSWMTREAIVAPFLFATGLGALWTGGGVLAWITPGVAAVFLYCQGQILRASKGIPAWRSPGVVELIIMTGLSEGAGLTLVLVAFAGFEANLTWLQGLLLALVAGRGLAWYAYRGRLDRDGAPARTFAALRAIEVPLAVFGLWGPILLLLVAFGVSSNGEWIAALAGICALAAGWLLKFTLITRAAYNQGFALPWLPVRGAGKSGPGAKPGWR